MSAQIDTTLIPEDIAVRISDPNPQYAPITISLRELDRQLRALGKPLWCYSICRPDQNVATSDMSPTLLLRIKNLLELAIKASACIGNLKLKHNVQLHHLSSELQRVLTVCKDSKAAASGTDDVCEVTALCDSSAIGNSVFICVQPLAKTIEKQTNHTFTVRSFPSDCNCPDEVFDQLDEIDQLLTNQVLTQVVLNRVIATLRRIVEQRTG